MKKATVTQLPIEPKPPTEPPHLPPTKPVTERRRARKKLNWVGAFVWCSGFAFSAFCFYVLHRLMF